MLRLIGALTRRKYGVPLIVHLNLRLAPNESLLDFAAPLDTALGSRGWGKVTGNAPDGDASTGVTLTLEVIEISRPVLDLVTDVLDDLCAPRGSTLRDKSGQILRIFGCAQSLALMFEDDLQALWGQTGDETDDVVSAVRRAMGARGRFHGLLRQDMGTAMCFLVPSAEDAITALQAILADHHASTTASVQRVA